MEIFKHITYLLYDNECVIVPQFGAFLTAASPGELNPSAHTASPKFKRVSFNERIHQSDGLLAQHLSMTMEIGHSEAIQAIQSDVISIKRQLEHDKNLEFGVLGTFYLTKEDKYLFVAKQQSNFEKSSYGLPILRLRRETIIVESQEPEAESTRNKNLSQREDHQEAQPVLKKRKERKQELQVQKFKREKTKRSRLSPLTILNSIGLVFLLALVFAILNQEIGSNSTVKMLRQQASLLDSPDRESETSAVDQNTESMQARAIISGLDELRNQTSYQILIDGTFSRDEVDKISMKLEERFPGLRIIEEGIDRYSIVLNNFKNQDLALEYLGLIRYSLKRPLIIKEQ